MYQLKEGQEGFTSVEGPLKGEFVPGRSYIEIPPGEERRFTEIKTDTAEDVEGKPSKGANKKGAANAPESSEVKS